MSGMQGMYRDMLRIRRFEETAFELFDKGEVVGGIHVSIGQEGCSVGACSTLKDNDAILTTHRGHGHSIAKGTRLPEMMAELLGKATGLCHAKGGSMHIADVSKGHYGAHSIVGSNMPMAVGIGLAFHFEGKGQVAVVFFGDGAANEGSFHESVNLASIWKLPVIFFCENNHFRLEHPGGVRHLGGGHQRAGGRVRYSRRDRGRNGRAGGLRGDGRGRGSREEGALGPQPDRGENLPVFRPFEKRPAVRAVPDGG